MATKSNLTYQQVDKWFSNARKRKCPDPIASVNKLTLLNYFYKINNKPGPKELEHLATITKMPEKKIYLWFSNERYLIKKN